MSKFASDLSRWASRAIGALKQSLSASAEALRRLIDYPHDPAARNPLDRPPIPGRPGVALLFPPEEPTPPALELERGLGLVVDNVYRVYAHQALVDEWNSEAEEWGWGKLHAQGIMTQSTLACAAALAPTWSPLPALDGAASYGTLANIDEVTSWLTDFPRSSLNSGLMRLMLEAWGPFADIRDLRPGTWPDWHDGHYGVVRCDDTSAQSYRWYLIYLGPMGCHAVELRIDNLATCLVTGLYSPTTWSDARKQLAEAWILRSAFLFENDVGEILISAQEYASAIRGTPLAHGWTFCHQRWGTAMEGNTEAMIVTLTESLGAYDTQTSKCEFTLSAGVLSANLTEVATGRAHLGASVRRNPTWLEFGGQLYAVDMETAAPPDVSATADIYMLDYDDDGPITAKAIREETFTTPAEPGRSGSAITACAGEDAESESWWRTATAIRKGGYEVGPILAARDIVDGAGEHIQRTFQINFWGAVIDVVTYDNDDYGACATPDGFTNVGVAEAFSECRSQDCPGYPDIGCIISDLPFGHRWIGVRWAQGSQHILRRKNRTYISADNGGNALIIPASDATAVCVVSGQTTSIIDELAPDGELSKNLPLDQYQNTRRFDFLPGIRGEYLFSLGRFRPVCSGYEDAGPPPSNPVCRFGDWIPIQWSSCSVGDPDAVCPINASWQSIDRQENVREIEAHWITGHGVEVCLSDYDAWAPFLVASVGHGEIRNWSPRVAVQYGPQILYQELPNGPLLSNAGHDMTAVEDAVEVKFICS